MKLIISQEDFDVLTEGPGFADDMNIEGIVIDADARRLVAAREIGVRHCLQRICDSSIILSSYVEVDDEALRIAADYGLGVGGAADDEGLCMLDFLQEEEAE